VSKPESSLLEQIRTRKLLIPEYQYRFAAIATGGIGKGVRKRLAEAELKDWAFDFAWPSSMIAIEVEGGSWVNGRHTRGAGFEEDCTKYNSATVMGWKVLRVTPKQVNNGAAMKWIERMVVV